MREEQQLVSLVEEKDVTAVDMLLARARPKFEAECQLGKYRAMVVYGEAMHESWTSFACCHFLSHAVS